MPRPALLSSSAGRIRPAVFADLQARIDARAAGGRDLVPLHIGDTCLAPPEAARRALASLDAEDASLFRYGSTRGEAALLARAASTMALRGVDVDPSSILIGNGGTHALYCVARAVLDPDDEVLALSPYWPLAPGVFASCGATVREVPVTQRLYADTSFDLAGALRAAIGPRTKAVYFISPNNPDGKILRRHDLEAIADVAEEHGLWIFADEVYAATSFGDAPIAMASLPRIESRTITLQSLSKSHALSGCRVGFAVAPPSVIELARRVSTHTAFNVSVAMQRVALAALEDASFVDVARSAYRSARDAAVAALEGSGARFHVAEGATYLFLDFSEIFEEAGATPESRPLLALLERAVDRGVLLAPGEAFGDYRSWARLCYTSVPQDRVIAGIERLRDAIEAFRHRMT